MPTTEAKNPNRVNETPRDKPMGERCDHANIGDRPGAQAHPRAARTARGWDAYVAPAAWRWN